MTDRELPKAGSAFSDPQQVQSLRAALKVVRNREAHLTDIAEEVSEAEGEYLRALAEKVRPLFDEVEAGDDRFELALSPGTRPRLWIDMTAFVVMGPDREGNEKSGYRLLRDTRFGRVALEESMDLDTATSAVATYMAERIVEREKMLEGDHLAAVALAPQRKRGLSEDGTDEADTLEPETVEVADPEPEAETAQVAESAAPVEPERKRRSRWFLWIVLGFLVGAIVASLWFFNAIGRLL